MSGLKSGPSYVVDTRGEEPLTGVQEEALAFATQAFNDLLDHAGEERLRTSMPLCAYSLAGFGKTEPLVGRGRDLMLSEEGEPVLGFRWDTATCIVAPLYVLKKLLDEEHAGELSKIEASRVSVDFLVIAGDVNESRSKDRYIGGEMLREKSVKPNDLN